MMDRVSTGLGSSYRPCGWNEPLFEEAPLQRRLFRPHEMAKHSVGRGGSGFEFCMPSDSGRLGERSGGLGIRLWRDNQMSRTDFKALKAAFLMPTDSG
jgi:hypothetical protein